MRINVYVFGNDKTPSSRLRWINYCNMYELDKEIEYKVFFMKDYIRHNKIIKEIEKCDIIVIQKRDLSVKMIRKFKEKCNKLVFDIDDAIWMVHSKYKFNLKVRLANIIHKFRLNKGFGEYDYIITSNNYIKEYISKYNKNIYVIPTSPSDKYMNLEIQNKEDTIVLKNKFIVGWTGTKDNLYYIKSIEKNIKKFFIDNEDAYLLILSDGKYISSDEKFNKKIINIKWSINNENYYIPKFDIGIMPSLRDEWSLGKAAYKLIYYMKHSKATIATEWGYQTEFINGKNGILINNDQLWAITLNELYHNSKRREQIQKEAYKTYKMFFDKEVIFNSYKSMFKDIVNINKK